MKLPSFRRSLFFPFSLFHLNSSSSPQTVHYFYLGRAVSVSQSVWAPNLSLLQPDALDHSLLGNLAIVVFGGWKEEGNIYFNSLRLFHFCISVLVCASGANILGSSTIVHTTLYFFIRILSTFVQVCVCVCVFALGTILIVCQSLVCICICNSGIYYRVADFFFASFLFSLPHPPSSCDTVPEINQFAVRVPSLSAFYFFFFADIKKKSWW